MCGQNKTGLCMNNGQCVVPCGGPGEPCCPGQICHNAACCVPGIMGGNACVPAGMNCFGMFMGGLIAAGWVMWLLRH